MLLVLCVMHRKKNLAIFGSAVVKVFDKLVFPPTIDEVMKIRGSDESKLLSERSRLKFFNIPVEFSCLQLVLKKVAILTAEPLLRKASPRTCILDARAQLKCLPASAASSPSRRTYLTSGTEV